MFGLAIVFDRVFPRGIMLDPQSRYKLRAINDLSDAPSGFGMGIGVAGLVLVAFIIFLAC